MEEAKSSRRYRWLLIAVIIVLAGWSAAWFGASYYAGNMIENMIRKEASKGRNWSCGERTITGFPFRMAIKCNKLAFSGPLDGKLATLSLGEFRAIAQIYNPRLIIAEADGPLQVKSDSRLRQLSARWSHLRASVRLTRPLPERISVKVDNLAAELKLQGRESETVSAKSGEFHLRPAPDVTADINAVDVAVILADLNVDRLQQIPSAAEPVNANIAARITRAGVLAVGRGRSKLENWRRAKGTITIQKSAVRKGSLQVEANGILHIDEERRPAGTINAKAAGMGQLLSRFGLGTGQNKETGIRSLVTKGLSRFSKNNEPDEPKKQRFIPLPLFLRDGNVWLGPFKTPVRLKPLY